MTGRDGMLVTSSLTPDRSNSPIRALIEELASIGVTDLLLRPPHDDSAVDLISAQRSFDASMQAVQTYKHLSDSSNEVGRVR